MTPKEKIDKWTSSELRASEDTIKKTKNAISRMRMNFYKKTHFIRDLHKRIYKGCFQLSNKKINNPVKVGNIIRIEIFPKKVYSGKQGPEEIPNFIS
jgi:hypothetical protein